MKTLRKGSNGAEVRVLQGLLGVDIDGKFGAITEAAVKSRQNIWSLAVDGICGKKTWERLAMAAKHLRRGDQGKDVRALQTLLGIKSDGVFGAGTEAVLKMFQKGVGLTADGIVDDATWAALLGGKGLPPDTDGVSNNGTFDQPPDYKQFSSPWAGKMYSATGDKKQTIKSSGCGPTAACGPVERFIGKKTTPDMLCELALKWKCRTANSGTTTSFFRKLADHYGLTCETTTDESKVAEALRSGAYVVARMGKGYWTKGGHYITLWKCDEKYFYANDPGSSTRKKATISSFRKEKKDYHILRRKKAA